MLYCCSLFVPHHCHPMRTPCHLLYRQHSVMSHMPHRSLSRSPVPLGHVWVFFDVHRRHGQVCDNRLYPWRKGGACYNALCVTHRQIDTRTQKHYHAHTCAHVCMHACTHTHARTHTRAHTHTHTVTHAQTDTRTYTHR